MKKVGITGNIGSGKSLVCSIFEKMHIPVFYADQQSKLLYQEVAVKREMILHFGNKIYKKDGSLNKELLSEKIFHDPAAMESVQKFLYPALRQKYTEWIGNQPGETPYCLYEAAILFETGFNKNFDHIVFVSAPETLRLERVQRRDRSSDKDIRSRMDQQWPESRKIPLSDFVIVNDGLQMLIPQILLIHHYLTKA